MSPKCEALHPLCSWKSPVITKAPAGSRLSHSYLNWVSVVEEPASLFFPNVPSTSAYCQQKLFTTYLCCFWITRILQVDEWNQWVLHIAEGDWEFHSFGNRQELKQEGNLKQNLLEVEPLEFILWKVNCCSVFAPLPQSFPTDNNCFKY